MTDPEVTQDDPSPDAEDQPDPPLNRAQRREQARGKGRSSPRRQFQDNLMSMAENQLAGETVDAGHANDHAGLDEATAGDSRTTGAGTGGATETAGRMPEHEAKNPEKNQPNS